MVPSKEKRQTEIISLGPPDNWCAMQREPLKSEWHSSFIIWFCCCAMDSKFHRAMHLKIFNNNIDLFGSPPRHCSFSFTSPCSETWIWCKITFVFLPLHSPDMSVCFKLKHKRFFKAIRRKGNCQRSNIEFIYKLAYLESKVLGEVLDLQNGSMILQ